MAHWHTVRKGESIPSIAERYGFVDWNVIYDHGENGDLRALRPDPRVLAPGDRVFIPNKEQKYVQIATEQQHRFQLKRQMERIELVMEDDEGNTFGGLRFEVQVGREVVGGTTAADGRLIAEVPAVADQATLRLWLSDDEDDVMSWTLDIGHLDPVDTVMGVQARLRNLGFDLAETGAMDEATEAAIAAFQERQGLDPTGTLDDALRDLLVQEHGS